MSLELQFPSPLRPLKRKFFEDGQSASESKRLCLPPLPILDHQQHDTSIARVMSADRPKRESGAPRQHEEILPRATSAPTWTTRKSSAQSSPSISSSSLRSSKLLCTRTPSTTNTALTGGSRSSSRINSTSYRDDLRRNNIVIESKPREFTSTVKEYRLKILKKDRESPKVPQESLDQMLATLHSLRNEDEDTIKSGYMSTGLFPNAAQYQGLVKVGSNIPLDPAGIPHNPLAPPLPLSKPDQHYCLDRMSFTTEEDHKQSSSALRQYANPSTAGCWPYLMVEFKSEARGGTFWAAENQNGGSGALCVKSMEKLLSFLVLERTEADSISFSCAVNAKHAEIWIHYYEDETFFSAELERFHMGWTKDIIFFRNCIRNIVEFGFKDRLPRIKKVLARIAVSDLEAEHKKPRARSASAAFNADEESKLGFEI